MESSQIIRYHFDHFDYRKSKVFITEEDIELLKFMKKNSLVDYKTTLYHFTNEQYVWRFYPELKTNITFIKISRQIEFKTNNSVPENIVFIVHLINKMTCFNARIRYYLNVLTWNQKMFLYYNRYYRYHAHKRKFGKKVLMKKKNNYKVHFTAWICYRQTTGVRLQRNYLRF